MSKQNGDGEGHTETGPRLKASFERLEKLGFELTTPGLQVMLQFSCIKH